MRNNDIKIIRYSETNENIEALTGKFGQVGNNQYCLTLLKNILFVNLYEGCNQTIHLPELYNGFLITSKNRIINVDSKTLEVNLDKDETAFGQLVLKNWN